MQKYLLCVINMQMITRPISEVTAHVLEKLKAQGEEFDTVVQLMANCPLRGANEIIEALTYFEKNSHSFQISSFRYGWMNHMVGS